MVVGMEDVIYTHFEVRVTPYEAVGRCASFFLFLRTVIGKAGARIADAPAQYPRNFKNKNKNVVRNFKVC